MKFWTCALLLLVGIGSAVCAMLLGLAAFAADSDAGQIAALGFEVASLVVAGAAVFEMERC